MAAIECSRFCAMEKKKLVWLIDDDDVSHYLHRQIINRSSQAVDVQTYNYASVALEALKDLLQKAESTLPSIIVLDINMPEMNGWQFLNAIQENDFGSRLEAIQFMVLSSALDTDVKDEISIYDLNVFHVSKPLTLKVLDELL